MHVTCSIWNFDHVRSGSRTHTESHDTTYAKWCDYYNDNCKLLILPWALFLLTTSDEEVKAGKPSVSRFLCR